jgi:hypothetical protein
MIQGKELFGASRRVPWFGYSNIANLGKISEYVHGGL